MKHELCNYIDDLTDTDIDYDEFFQDYYGYTTYYVSLNEFGEELEDLEDNNTTLNEFIKNNIINNK